MSTKTSIDAIQPAQAIWIDEPESLSDLIATLTYEPLVAIDTESDSLYSYFEKVCLIQFSTPTADFLVDPLRVDVGDLAKIFANPAIQKVFHAAEYDILSLKRDFGFTFVNLFDTMLAARILGWKRYGLGSLLAEHFGVRLDKRFQRYNWGRRPLSTQALDYARLDTHYLLPLRKIQLSELQRQNRLREAHEAFERQTRLEPTPKIFNPDDFWRVKGVRDLDPQQQAVLRELYMLRDKIARQLDYPPFKVLADPALLHLSRTQPRTVQNLASIKGVSSRILIRFGRQILAAIQRGRTAVPPDHPPTNNHFPDQKTLTRYETLRRWRNQLAARRGVEPDVIISNSHLMDIARRNPGSLAALTRLGILGDWQFETYGKMLLKVLKSLSQ